MAKSKSGKKRAHPPAEEVISKSCDIEMADAPAPAIEEPKKAFVGFEKPIARKSEFSRPPDNKNAGIYEWMLDPIRIPADVSDPAYSVPISDKSLKLDERVCGVFEEMGISSLFPVQSSVITTLLGHLPEDRCSWDNMLRYHLPGQHPGDLLVSAPTGSGKTLAYVVPVVESLKSRNIPRLRALVILPTMDLVKQVKAIFDKFVSGTDLLVVAISGGSGDDDIQNGGFQGELDAIMGTCQSQFDDFDRAFLGEMATHVQSRNACCDILISTPGRLVDHMASGLAFTDLQWLVIDEADRLLNQTFNTCISLVMESINALPTASLHSGTSPISVRDASVYSILRRHKLLESAYGDTFNPVDDLPSSQNMGTVLGAPTHCRKILFSATITRNPGKIASLQLQNPRMIASVMSSDVELLEGKQDEIKKYILPSSLEQFYWVCPDAGMKPLYIIAMLYQFKLTSTLCFTNSIEHAQRLCNVVSKFVELHSSTSDHSWKPQVAHYSSSLSTKERTALLAQFNAGEINILICTDALSRGIDLALLQDASSENPQNHAIINYDPPINVKTYVHRAGRTARAGKTGIVHSILNTHECRFWKAMMRKHSLYDNMMQSRLNIDETTKATYEEALKNVRENLGRERKQ
eukprot:Partr_v1_DN27896_c3_g1_i1_m23055 putative ATPdependent RNA helicase